MRLFTGEGLIEMSSDKITGSSEEGEVLLKINRKSGNAFPAEVSWSAQDGDALFGEHYDLNSG